LTFFFSSRRRHTIFSRDWSSDVCSSDLAALARFITQLSNAHARLLPLRLKVDSFNEEIGRIDRAVQRASEERDHILSLIRQGSPAGAPDPSRWPMLQDKLDSEQARIDGLLQRRRQLEDQLLPAQREGADLQADRQSTRLNSSHVKISYAVFCLKKKNPH